MNGSTDGSPDGISGSTPCLGVATEQYRMHRTCRNVFLGWQTQSCSLSVIDSAIRAMRKTAKTMMKKEVMMMMMTTTTTITSRMSHLWLPRTKWHYPSAPSLASTSHYAARGAYLNPAGKVGMSHWPHLSWVTAIQKQEVWNCDQAWCHTNMHKSTDFWLLLSMKTVHKRESALAPAAEFMFWLHIQLFKMH